MENAIEKSIKLQPFVESISVKINIEGQRRDDENTALSYAFAAEFFGFKLLYLEAGSGAPEPVGCNVIRRIKESVKIPVIVGGGIRDYGKARSIIDAGADIIVTGTVIEKHSNPYMALKDIISAI